MAAKRKEKKQASKDLEITHSTLVDWVNEADTASEESRGISEKSRDYYDSKQLTAAEVRALKKRKQPIVVINRIKPKLDALMGMEKSAKTTVKAYPRTPTHQHDADSATEAIRFVLQDNHFDQVRSVTWEFNLIEGSGGCEVIVKQQKDKSMKIVINPIFWDRMIYDPHSRRKHFTDARYLGQVVWMDYDEALALNPEAKDVLDTTISGSSTFDDKPQWVDTSRRRVKMVELYYRDEGEWTHAIFTRGGYIEEPKISPFLNEEGETEHAYEFVSAFVDREGQRYGAAKQLLDIQDEINKRRSKALHLMSVRQVRWERGAVDDINKARDELAKPDGVLETTPGMEFEVLKTGDMAAAQFNLLTEAKMEIDAVGVNAALTGKDQRAISGVALQERKLAGQTELGPLFDGLKYWQLRVFRKVWNRIRQYWDEERWIRVTDDERNQRWIGLNAPLTAGDALMQKAQAQGMEGPELETLKQRIAADPQMSAVVGKRNPIAELDVDIIIDEVPDTLTQQTEDFQAMAEMVKSGFPIPPAAVIEASNLSNKDKILKAMEAQGGNIPPKVREQMAQMAEQLQTVSQENQQLKGRQAETLAKIAADKEEAQANFNLQGWKDEQELILKKNKQDGEAQLAREKAEAEHGLRVLEDQRAAAIAADTNDRAQQDAEFKRGLMAQEKGMDAETDVMPVLLEKIEQSLSPLAALVEVLQRIDGGIQQMQRLQAETLAEMKRPKSVAVGAVQYDAMGQVIGATVQQRSVTIQ